jgi:hypothetical protein
MERWEEIESKDVKGNGKASKEVKKKTKQRNKQKNFKDKNSERQCTNQL